MQRKSAVEDRGYEVARVVFRVAIRKAIGAVGVLLAGERQQHTMLGKGRHGAFPDRLATVVYWP